VSRFADTHHGFWLHLQALCEIIVVVLFIVTFLAQPFRIPSESMLPTLRVGDFLLGNKQAYAPRGALDSVLAPESIQRGDIIIFRFPDDPKTYLVKRVIALPGERVRLHANTVFINGAPLSESYAVYTPSPPNDFRDNFPSLRYADPDTSPAWWAAMRRSTVDHEITVPSGHYFVLGDNRNDSEDSRYWGFVPKDMIVARPTFVYLSFSAPAVTKGTFSHRVWMNFRQELASIRILR